MTDPTRVYSAQLPLFPEVYQAGGRFLRQAALHGRTGASRCAGNHPSPGRRAAPAGKSELSTFEPPLGRSDAAAVIRVEYRLHTYNRMQHEQDEYRFWQTLAAAVLLPTTLFALFLVVRFLRRERRRELDRWQSTAAAEHRERELLETPREAAGGRAGQRGTWPQGAGATTRRRQAGKPRRGGRDFRTTTEVAALRQHRHHGRQLRPQHQEPPGAPQRSARPLSRSRRRDRRATRHAPRGEDPLSAR